MPRMPGTRRGVKTVTCAVVISCDLLNLPIVTVLTMPCFVFLIKRMRDGYEFITASADKRDRMD